MKNTPFTPNPDKKVEKMVEAANHIYAAIKALEDARLCSGNWSEYSTISDFKLELARYMSCDNGEAGFEPYLEKKADQIFPRQDNPVRKARQMAQVYNRKGTAVQVCVPQE